MHNENFTKFLGAKKFLCQERFSSKIYYAMGVGPSCSQITTTQEWVNVEFSLNTQN